MDLNNELKHIGEWAFQWNMYFNPHPTKLAQELIFSRKMQMTNHPPLFFNQSVVLQTSLQKHLGMFLDSKLNFSEHLKIIIQKTNKTIGLLPKLQTYLPRAPLIKFINMIYDQTFNVSFQQKWKPFSIMQL